MASQDATYLSHLQKMAVPFPRGCPRSPRLCDKGLSSSREHRSGRCLSLALCSPGCGSIQEFLCARRQTDCSSSVFEKISSTTFGVNTSPFIASNGSQESHSRNECDYYYKGLGGQRCCSCRKADFAMQSSYSVPSDCNPRGCDWRLAELMRIRLPMHL